MSTPAGSRKGRIMCQPLASHADFTAIGYLLGHVSPISLGHAASAPTWDARVPPSARPSPGGASVVSSVATGSDGVVSAKEAYFAYMLRLWRAAADGHLAWRASLEDPQTGERLGFADLGALFDYLAQRTATGSAPPDLDRGPTAVE